MQGALYHITAKGNARQAIYRGDDDRNAFSGNINLCIQIPLFDYGITIVILNIMKTAISIPDAVFNVAERLAKRLGVSRSELYVRAISSYIEEHKGQKVTELLNEIYGGMENQELETGFKRAQMKSISKEVW